MGGNTRIWRPLQASFISRGCLALPLVFCPLVGEQEGSCVPPVLQRWGDAAVRTVALHQEGHGFDPWVWGFLGRTWHVVVYCQFSPSSTPNLNHWCRNWQTHSYVFQSCILDALLLFVHRKVSFEFVIKFWYSSFVDSRSSKNPAALTMHLVVWVN